MSVQNVMNVKMDLNDILQKLREVSNKSSAFSDVKPVADNIHNVKQNNFANMLSDMQGVMGNVNNAISQSDQLKEAYVMGDKSVSLSQVLVASQKSKIAFEGLITVRNKILEAYKEVMNMPV